MYTITSIQGIREMEKITFMYTSEGVEQDGGGGWKEGDRNNMN